MEALLEVNHQSDEESEVTNQDQFDQITKRLEGISEALNKTNTDIGSVRTELTEIKSTLGWHWKAGAAVTGLFGLFFGYMIQSFIPNQIAAQVPSNLKQDFGSLQQKTADIQIQLNRIESEQLSARTKVASSQPTKPQYQADAISVLEDAQKRSIAIPVSVVAESGKSFVDASGRDEKAWAVALNYISYRTSLNKSPISRATPPAERPHKDGFAVGILIFPKDGETVHPPRPRMYGSTTADKAALFEPIPTQGGHPGSDNAEFAVLDFEGQGTSLDNVRMRNLVIVNAVIHYTGKSIDLENVFFINCKFDIKRNQNTEHFAGSVLQAEATTFKASASTNS